MAIKVKINSKTEPVFPRFMRHELYGKEHGGVYKFYSPTERVCIDAGTAPVVAVHRIDADITRYELFNGEAILSNA